MTTPSGLLMGFLALLAVLAGAALWVLWRLLARQTRALAALETLAEETRRLQPFYARFEEAAGRLQQATHLLAEPGHLQEWVDAVQGAMQPLETVQASLEEQYAVGDQLLETTGMILEQAARQRERVEASTERMAALLEQWTADELVRRQEAEAELARHYRETGAQSERMTEGLLELRGSVAHLANTLTAIERIAEALEALAARQRGAAPAQDQAAARLAALQEQAADQAAQLQEWQEEVLVRYRQAGTALASAMEHAPDPREQRRHTVLLGLIGVLLLALTISIWMA